VGPQAAPAVRRTQAVPRGVAAAVAAVDGGFPTRGMAVTADGPRGVATLEEGKVHRPSFPGTPRGPFSARSDPFRPRSDPVPGSSPQACSPRGRLASILGEHGTSCHCRTCASRTMLAKPCARRGRAARGRRRQDPRGSHSPAVPRGPDRSSARGDHGGPSWLGNPPPDPLYHGRLLPRDRRSELLGRLRAGTIVPPNPRLLRHWRSSLAEQFLQAP